MELKYKLIILFGMGILIAGTFLTLGNNFFSNELLPEVISGFTALAKSFDSNDTRLIGFEFLNASGNISSPADGVTVHMWNDRDDYFFDKDKGIQLTNHFQDYWTRNTFCIGTHDGLVNGTMINFQEIKCADDLSSFSRTIDTDNLTYVNATLWKDFSYGAYDLRLAVNYLLVPDDEDIDITIYAKNIGIDIPKDLGFKWKIEDWDITPSSSGDTFFINGNYYDIDTEIIDETFNEVGTVPVKGSHLMGMDGKESLSLYWNETLTYEVEVKGNGVREDFNVSLLIHAGHFNPGQEKSTTLQWIDDYADLSQHGDDYVLDDAACGTNTNDMDDFLETFEVGSYQAQTLRFKYCIVGQQDIPSNMTMFFSETTDNIGTWDNSSAPYFYPMGDQGSSAEIRWRDSPWVTHNATAACVQTDDHSPEVGRVLEQNIPYPQFLSQPSANNRCQEHEIIFEHFGTDVGTWQLSMAINGSNIADSGMHGREGIEYILVAATTTPPIFADNSTNGTDAGTWVEHSINITDATGVDGYIFAFDNGTGTFVNDSWVSTFALQAWGNTTKFINETSSTIRWQWFANDTVNNWNSSEIYTLTTVADEQAPFLTMFHPENRSYNVTEVWINYTVSDDNLNECKYSDDGGALNKTLTNCLNETYDGTEGQTTITLWADDIFSNLNRTEVTLYFDFTVPDIDFVSPTTANGSFEQNFIEVNITSAEAFIDTINVTLYDSSFNLVQTNSTNGTDYESYFFSNLTSLPTGLYYLNATINDTAGNTNQTETRNITLTAADTCTYPGSGNWNVLCSDNCDISSPVIGAGGTLQLSGTGVFNINADISEFDTIIKENSCQIIKSNSAQVSLT